MLTMRERERCLARSVPRDRKRGTTDTPRLRDRRTIGAARGRIVEQGRRRRAHDEQLRAFTEAGCSRSGGWVRLLRKKPTTIDRPSRCASACAFGLALGIAFPAAALAQAAGGRSDAGVDADEARTDALLGALNLSTPEPYGNLYSTAPGAEQQVERPQFRFNLLAPLNFRFQSPRAGVRE